MRLVSCVQIFTYASIVHHACNFGNIDVLNWFFTKHRASFDECLAVSLHGVVFVPPVSLCPTCCILLLLTEQLENAPHPALLTFMGEYNSTAARAFWFEHNLLNPFSRSRVRTEPCQVF